MLNDARKHPHSPTTDTGIDAMTRKETNVNNVNNRLRSIGNEDAGGKCPVGICPLHDSGTCCSTLATSARNAYGGSCESV